MSHTASTSQSRSHVSGRPDRREIQPTRDLVDYAREYARERPEVVALWCFGIGFILGWKLKPW